MIQRVLLLLIATLAALPASAQESEPRWYQVEIVVFLNQTAAQVTREEWSRDPGRPDLHDAVTLQPIPEAAAGLVPFQLLPPEDLELGALAEKLQRSGHYRPLLHTGWREPVAENQSEFPPVRIEVPLQPPAPDAATLAAEAQPTADTPATAPGEPPSLSPIGEAAAAEAAPLVPGIEGIIRLRVSRYLHLDVDLLYSKEMALPPEMMRARQAAGGIAPLSSETSPAALQEPSLGSNLMVDFLGMPSTYLQSYRLNEDRRLRRDELHYFDHPMFGVLAKVSAYELPAAEAVPAVAPAQPVQPPVPVTNPGKATAQPLRQ